MDEGLYPPLAPPSFIFRERKEEEWKKYGEELFLFGHLDFSTFFSGIYRPFHKTLPKSKAFVNWISGRFYETDCTKEFFLQSSNQARRSV